MRKPELAAAIAEAQAIGFNLEGEAIAIKNVGQKLRGPSRDYDMLVTGSSYGIGPYEFNQQWTSEALKNKSNYMGYTNPILDSLTAISESTYDLKKRREVTMEMQKIWYHDQPALYLINLPTFSAARKRYGVKELSVYAPNLWLNNLNTKGN